MQHRTCFPKDFLPLVDERVDDGLDSLGNSVTEAND